MNVRQKLKEAKDFVKRNKKKFVVGTVLVLGGCVVVIFTKDGRRRTKKLMAANEKDAQAIMDSLDRPFREKELMRRIDEDIFTDLAPRIETLVLEEGLDESYIEETYKLSEDVIKKVCVHITKEGS